MTPVRINILRERPPQLYNRLKTAEPNNNNDDILKIKFCFSLIPNISITRPNFRNSIGIENFLSRTELLVIKSSFVITKLQFSLK